MASLSSNTTFDFVIWTLPRSGSHMLASALDSHPDIQCVAEVWNAVNIQDAGKRLRGTTLMPHAWNLLERRPGKAIVLIRDAAQRCAPTRHGNATSPNEAREHVEYDTAFIGEQIMEARRRASFLIETARYEFRETLVLDYSDITGNVNCIEIPECLSRRICDFLGVEYAPLNPAFYKPV